MTADALYATQRRPERPTAALSAVEVAQALGIELLPWQRQVLDNYELVNLRPERGEAAVEIRVRPMRHDDGRDAHTSSRYTSSVRRAVSVQL